MTAKTVPSIRTEPRPSSAKRLPAYGPRAFRKLVGLSLPLVSKRSGYSQEYVRRIERDYERVAESRMRGRTGYRDRRSSAKTGKVPALLAPPQTAERIAWALRSDAFPDGAPVDIFYRFEPC